MAPSYVARPRAHRRQREQYDDRFACQHDSQFVERLDGIVPGWRSRSRDHQSPQRIAARRNYGASGAAFVVDTLHPLEPII